MHGITLRPYRDSDWEAICVVHDRARPRELEGSCDARAFVPLAEDSTATDIHRCRKQVACDGDRVVGFVGVDGTYLAWLYVDPDYTRRGIGRRMLRWAIEQVDGDASTVVLEGNASARHLYESEGFVVTRRFSGDNAGYPCTCLELTREGVG